MAEDKINEFITRTQKIERWFKNIKNVQDLRHAGTMALIDSGFVNEQIEEFDRNYPK